MDIVQRIIRSDVYLTGGSGANGEADPPPD
jgi:hypothetical protein